MPIDMNTEDNNILSNQVNINTASFSFLGLMPYSKKKLVNKDWKVNFKNSDFLSQNADYFTQKYYENWLRGIFSSVYEDSSINNHLIIKEDHQILSKHQNIHYKEESKKIVISYSIRSIEVFLFPNELGVFIIKIDMPEEHLNWQDITAFGWNFRNTTINKKHNIFPPTLELIEDVITKNFHSDQTAWRKFNPHLKTAVFVDIDKQLEDSEMNYLLYSLATLSNPTKVNNLYVPEESFYNNLLNNFSISVFKNWKTLCLFDTMARIAVNLNEKDKYKLWENEYVIIYVYVIYLRFFLYDTNRQLVQASNNSQNLVKTRSAFFKFINNFHHSRISYKFLPNEIYIQLKKSLEIEEEIYSIEKTITRMNRIQQEKNEKNLARILFILTLLTLISVSYDGGQWLSRGENKSAFSISLSIFLFAIIIMTIVYLYYKHKK